MEMLNTGNFWGIVALLFQLVCLLIIWADKSGATKEAKRDELPAQPTQIGPTWHERLKKGLAKTRQEVWGKLEAIVSKGLSSDTLDEVEELLYSADIGASTVNEIVEELKTKSNSKEEFTVSGLKDLLFSILKNKMGPIQQNIDGDLFKWKGQSANQGPKVILIVGVNGAGKTTTIGKLATKLTRQGAKVVVGACDTFRAAAVDQLEVWCQRSKAKMIRAKEGGDPSGVAYLALETAIKEKSDYCLLDTAGRLQNKSHLMEELKKNKRVLGKLDQGAPHHTLLVIDSITGQNALSQAEEFHKALELSGLIFTKLDGSSKAGNAVSIVQKLQVPITYVGVGESVEDLNAFNLDEYLKALLDMPALA